MYLGESRLTYSKAQSETERGYLSLCVTPLRLFLDQKQELSICFVRIAHPLVRPAHPAHDVPFVIHFDDVDQLSRVVMTSFSSSAVARPPEL